MTKEQKLALVNQQLNSYNDRDLDSFCKCYHPEVKVEYLTLNKPATTGLVNFKEGYQKLFESSPTLKCEIRSRIILENTIIDEEWVSGSAFFPEGLHATAIYGFRDGLIDRVWFAR
jgi:hypothetical protein